MAKSIHKYGCYKPWFVEKILKTVIKDDIVCDVGSNVGYYSLLFSKILSSPQNIYSFESDLYFIKYFNKNRSTTNIVNKYVSDGIKEDSGSVSLDSYFLDNDQHKPSNFLKVDIDGFEVNLVRGAENLIEKHHPKILMEIHPRQIKSIQDDGIEYMFNFLGKHYKFEYIANHWGKIKGYDEWKGVSAHEWEEVGQEFLINYCNEKINDNKYRKAAIHKTRILPKGFGFFVVELVRAALQSRSKT